MDELKKLIAELKAKLAEIEAHVESVEADDTGSDGPGPKHPPKPIGN
jgi:hypothetical protein